MKTVSSAFPKLTLAELPLARQLLGNDPAAGELLLSLQVGIENFYGVYRENALAGLLQAAPGRQALLNLYISPFFRGQGLGGSAASFGEKLLFESQRTVGITACCLKEDASALAFLAKRGFVPRFSSARMVYTGPAFSVSDRGVRPYRDEDYDRAHKLYAQAFHRMRLLTGDFPDSREEPSSQRMRAYWEKTADARFVLEDGGSVVGYAHLEGSEIGSVSIDPSQQGRGLGGRFLQCMVNELLRRGCKNVSLLCLLKNPAYALYEKTGFSPAYSLTYSEKNRP